MIWNKNRNQSVYRKIKKLDAVAVNFSHEKWRYRWSKMKHLFRIFCETTTMHGFRNIVAHQISVIEKLIWTIICFLSLSLCIFLIGFSYHRAHDKFTLIQLTSEKNHLSVLNFPAVTVCNLNKVYKPTADLMEKKLLKAGFNNVTINNFFLNLPQLVHPGDNPVGHEIFNKMLYFLNIDLKNLMGQLMQPCDKLLKSCSWAGNPFNCSILFKTVDSYLGHCCGFNYHIAETHPQMSKTPGFGKHSGLTAEINIEPEMYRGSVKEYPGAKIIIHKASDYPETNIRTLTIRPYVEKAISVSGIVVKSLEEIKILPVTNRECLFQEDVGYKYSTHSCYAGCKMGRILQACDCIPYYYPKANNNIIYTCDFKNIKCLRTYQFEIARFYEDFKLNNGRTLTKCQCRETCDDIYYNILINEHFKKILDCPHPCQNPEISPEKFATFHVFFTDNGFMNYTRSRFMTWTDLIAAIGGFVGICLGGSFISLMEPVIYLLLTPFRRAHRQRIRQTKEKAQKAARQKFWSEID